MKEMSVGEAASNLGAVLREMERTEEEIVLTLNDHRVARIIPEAGTQTALEVMGDIHGTLDPDAGEAWDRQIKGRRLSGRLSELGQPWRS